MTWSKHDHHWRIAETQQGCVSPVADLPCVPEAQLNTFSGWAGTAPASAHSVSSSLIPLPLNIFVSLLTPCNDATYYLPFLFCLNVQLTSQGPASAKRSSYLLTILYHDYGPLEFGGQNQNTLFWLTVQIPLLPTPSAESCFSDLSALVTKLLVIFFRASCTVWRNHSVWKRTQSFERDSMIYLKIFCLTSSGSSSLVSTLSSIDFP